MKQQEQLKHEDIVKSLKDKEQILTDLISKVDNDELHTVYIDWQTLRNEANELYLKIIEEAVNTRQPQSQVKELKYLTDEAGKISNDLGDFVKVNYQHRLSYTEELGDFANIPFYELKEIGAKWARDQQTAQPKSVTDITNNCDKPECSQKFFDGMMEVFEGNKGKISDETIEEFANWFCENYDTGYSTSKDIAKELTKWLRDQTSEDCDHEIEPTGNQCVRCGKYQGEILNESDQTSEGWVDVNERLPEPELREGDKWYRISEIYLGKSSRVELIAEIAHVKKKYVLMDLDEEIKIGGYTHWKYHKIPTPPKKG